MNNIFKWLTISTVCFFSICTHAKEASILITTYGAVGDGKTLNTSAIQSSIDACHKQGGGCVVVPAGTFLSGTIVMKDNVELNLDEKAVLLASTRHEDFPTFHPEYRSHKDINGFHALIYAEKAENITYKNITIEGTTAPIFVRLGKRNRPHTAGAKVTHDGVMRNITITGVTATGCGDLGCAILGLPGSPIQNLTLSEIDITFEGGGTENDAARHVPEKPRGYPQPNTWGKLPAYGFFIRNTENVTLKNLKLKTVKPDKREPVTQI